MISSISSGFDRLSILIRSYPLPCPLLRRRGREGERMPIVADVHTMAAPQPFWPSVTLSPRHLSGERAGERGIKQVGPRSIRGRGSPEPRVPGLSRSQNSKWPSQDCSDHVFSHGMERKERKRPESLPAQKPMIAHRSRRALWEWYAILNETGRLT